MATRLTDATETTRLLSPEDLARLTDDGHETYHKRVVVGAQDSIREQARRVLERKKVKAAELATQMAAAGALVETHRAAEKASQQRGSDENSAYLALLGQQRKLRAEMEALEAEVIPPIQPEPAAEIPKGPLAETRARLTRNQNPDEIGPSSAFTPTQEEVEAEAVREADGHALIEKIRKDQAVQAQKVVDANKGNVRKVG